MGSDTLKSTGYQPYLTFVTLISFEMLVHTFICPEDYDMGGIGKVRTLFLLSYHACNKILCLQRHLRDDIEI